MHRIGLALALFVGAVLLVGVAVGSDNPLSRAAQRTQHPALAPYGVDFTELPQDLYLVRSRGHLPASAGVVVHGVRNGVYLVSGDHDAVMSLQNQQCDVFPVDELPVFTGQPAPRHWTTISSPNANIESLVSGVEWARIRERIDWLVDFATRYSYADNHQQVADEIAAEFDALGLATVKHSFVYNNTTMWNVEATQIGTVYPDSFVVMCAHFDSRSENPYILAPGADDNGTGVAAVLVTAELLRAYQFEYSIRYLCFGGEEQWLKGSQAYVQWAADNNIGIVGALNFDMIGYWEPGVPRDLEIGTNTASQWLAAAVANAADLYVGAPYQIHVDNSSMWSDHASFWAHGYAALNHEEAWDGSHLDWNPHYHTSHDSIAYVHPEFTVDNVKIGVASVATLARLENTASAAGGPVPPVAAAVITAHPNPFNQRVALTVTGISDHEHVRLIIYDTLGRRVAEMPVELRGGNGTAYWNPAGVDRADVTSGVYFGVIGERPDVAPTKIVFIK